MQTTPLSRIGRQSWALGGLVAATAISVVLSISAWAGEDPAEDGYCPPQAASMHGGPEGGMPSAMMPFAGRGLERMLSHLEATASQKDQIHKLADAAAPDMKALHEQGQALHEQALKLWAAPKLDAAAAEQLRQKMSTHHEQMSKRMLQLALDIGQVLTPEQRAKMAQHMQTRMQQHMRGHHHGSHPDHAAAPAKRDN